MKDSDLNIGQGNQYEQVPHVEIFNCVRCGAALIGTETDNHGCFGLALKSLGAQIVEINTANGWNVTHPNDWHDTYKIPGVLALIHSEVSEALEGFRAGDKENFEEELADVLIRVLDCATGLGLDLDAAVAAKLEKNRGRGFRHGGKRL